MGKRSRESFQKRAREKIREEKKAAKRAKRELEDPANEETTTSRAEEDALMQEYAMLSARFEADQISIERYNEERHRIFVELGIED